MNTFKTPVLFLIFNRPDTTQQVFDEIKKIKPQDLYVAADGPRSDRPQEAAMCETTRAIIQQVDWECKIHTLFREQNLGCRKAVSSAIDWFFEAVEEGIVLEDDCLPNQDFFWFCQNMLEYHREDTRIMHISGCNLQYGKKRGEASYYLSRHVNIWGWASWKRAWKHYDVEMKAFPQFKKQNKIEGILQGHPKQARYLNLLYKVFKRVDTWDFQWSFAVFTQNGLAITPNKNLISNIGFGTQSTHANYKKSKLANVPRESLEKNINHPTLFMPDKEADDFFIDITMRLPPIPFRLIKKSQKAISILRKKIKTQKHESLSR